MYTFSDSSEDSDWTKEVGLKEEVQEQREGRRRSVFPLLELVRRNSDSHRMAHFASQKTKFISFFKLRLLGVFFQQSALLSLLNHRII